MYAVWLMHVQLLLMFRYIVKYFFLIKSNNKLMFFNLKQKFKIFCRLFQDRVKLNFYYISTYK